MKKPTPPGGPPKPPSDLGDPRPLKDSPFSSLKDQLREKQDMASIKAREDANQEELKRISTEQQTERDQARPADRLAAEERLKKGPSLDVRFSAALKHNFSQFPPKGYETLLPGLKIMGVRQSVGGKELLLTLVPEKNPPVTREYPGYVSMIVSGSGEVKGELPKELKQAGLTHDLIKDELLHIAEELRIGFWIFKTVDGAQGLGGSPMLTGNSTGRNQISREEMERLKFLDSLDNAVFGAMVSSSRGFDDYNAIFLKKGTAVFDNKVIGNAVYIIRDLPPIPQPVLTQAEKNQYFEEHIRPLIQGGKQKARSKGAIRITHQGGDWKKAILQNI